jgi:hypothetical protein
MGSVALNVVFAGLGGILVSAADVPPSTGSHERGAADAAVPVPALVAKPAAPTSSAPLAPATLTDVVQRYCVVCHNDAMLTGNLSLQRFDVARAAEMSEAAERMIRKLRVGMMPPPGMPRPAGDTLQQLVETLESTVDQAARAHPNLGERRFQRPSRAEYERLVRELLDLDVDAAKWLPADLLMGAFDNQSAAQPFSPTVVQAFMRAGSEVARLAVGNANAVSTTTKIVNPIRVSQHAWNHIEGTPYGTRGGMVVNHDFPADGEYVFQVVTSMGINQTIADEQLDLSVNGEPLALLKLEHNGTKVTGRKVEGAVTPTVTTDPLFVPAGQNSISVAFVNLVVGPYDDRFQPPDWSQVGPGTARDGGEGVSSNFGITGLTHVTELWITGPLKTTGLSETASRRKIFTCRPQAAGEQRRCAESILGRLASQAYRRPATKADVDGLMGFYDRAAAAEGFEAGVRTGVQAILVSPNFLFRIEEEPANAQPGEVYRVSDVELASRLSFFLWAAAPDEELLDVATGGRLAQPRVLERQVRRMLRDPKAQTMSTRFAHQWLQLQNVTKVWPQAYYYPDFTAQLGDDMVRETQLFFQHLVEEDRSLLELFTADYTFVNERLARHYDIEGVFGEEFRRVPYPDARRRGILSHGSVLKLTSMADRTSPVLRGKWVMSVLMGSPPPPPPANVPPFEASSDAGNGRRLTTRERMEMHRSAVVCNSCHRFMDPIGLALDNFDATGRWRIRENMAVLDTRGDFYDGTPVSNPGELVAALMKRPVPLVRNFTENLLSYSIGRAVEPYDMPTVRAIARAAEADDYRISSLILGVVKSDAFQMRQAQATSY